MHPHTYNKYRSNLLTEIFALNEQFPTFTLTYEQRIEMLKYSLEDLIKFRCETFPIKPIVGIDCVFLKAKLSDLDFQTRTFKYFKYLKISTVEQLLRYSVKDFKALRNCGKGTIDDIQRELAHHGYFLKPF